MVQHYNVHEIQSNFFTTSNSLCSQEVVVMFKISVSPPAYSSNLQSTPASVRRGVVNVSEEVFQQVASMYIFPREISIMLYRVFAQFTFRPEHFDISAGSEGIGQVDQIDVGTFNDLNESVY